MQGSGGMAAEIGCSQTGQRFFFRQFGGRWNSFVQKGIGVLSSTAFSATHNTFDFGTRHKAGHVVVVCKQSRTFKMFRNLLFRQASLPAEDIPEYGMASVILLFRDFQTMSFCIRIIGGFDALCREFQGSLATGGQRAVSLMNEISISFNWRDEKAFFGTESAPAAGVMGSRIRQQGRLLELDVLTG